MKNWISFSSCFKIWFCCITKKRGYSKHEWNHNYLLSVWFSTKKICHLSQLQTKPYDKIHKCRVRNKHIDEDIFNIEDFYGWMNDECFGLSDSIAGIVYVSHLVMPNPAAIHKARTVSSPFVIPRRNRIRKH